MERADVKVGQQIMVRSNGTRHATVLRITRMRILVSYDTTRRQGVQRWYSKANETDAKGVAHLDGAWTRCECTSCQLANATPVPAFSVCKTCGSAKFATNADGVCAKCLVDARPAFNGKKIIAMMPILGSDERVMVAEHRHSEIYGTSYVMFIAGPQDTYEWLSGRYFDASPYATSSKCREDALRAMVERSGLR